MYLVNAHISPYEHGNIHNHDPERKRRMLMHRREIDKLSALIAEKGLTLIAKALEDGFFIPQSDAYLQVLYDDPGFAPIRAKQEARQVRERESFLAIVCGDNP